MSRDDADYSVPIQPADYSIPSEHSVLGAMLVDNSIIDAICAIVRPADFAAAGHGTLFETIVRAASGGGVADAITVHEALQAAGLADTGEVFTRFYLWQLTSELPAIRNARKHAEIVAQYATQRAARRALADIARAADTAGTTGEELCTLLRSAADELSAHAGGTSFDDCRLPSFTEIARGEQIHLDFVLDGLVAGTVGCLAGYGAAGKGMVGLALAIDVALGGRDGVGRLTGMSIKNSPARAAFVTIEDTPLVMAHRQQRLAFALRTGGLGARCTLAPDDFDAIGERFTTVSLYGKPQATLLLPSGRGQFVRNERLISWLKRRFAGYRLIILDTYRKIAGAVEENDSAAGSLVLGIMDEIAVATSAAIIFVHHLSKPATGVEDPTVFSIRGSGALVADARWAAVLAAPSEKLACQRGIDVAERGDWRRLDLGKVNHGAGGEHWFRNHAGVFVGADLPGAARSVVRDPMAEVLDLTKGRRGRSEVF